MSVRRLASKELQPANFTFSEENLAWAKQQIAKYPPGRQASAVIPILWRVQEQHDGWVSEAAIRAVAHLLEMPHIRVLEIATFYTMFQLQPVGKKAHIQVCGTTPCRLRGAEDIIDVCKNRIHHEPFHLSEDGNFSWEEVECLGACVNAPMVLIWKETYEDLTAENFSKVLDGFAAGTPPTPGSQIGRQFSAPIGGPTTLKSDAPPSKTPSAPRQEPVLADAEPKKPGEAANVQERPIPKPPMGDASRKKKK
jgi:NADH-quinone oxidoreductase subunit E